MIKGLEWAAIWSEDLTNLLPFYRDVMGLAVIQEWDGYVMLRGSEDGPSVNLGTHSEVKGAATDQYRHMVGLRCDGLDAEYARLSAAGVEFIETPTDYGAFRMATLKDPEGNLIQLYQPVS